MKRAILIIGIVIGVVVIAAAAVYAGTLLGSRYLSQNLPVQPQISQQSNNSSNNDDNSSNNNAAPVPDYANPSYGFGPGMGYGSRGNGGYGPGMMNGYGYNTDSSITPLTVDQAYTAAQDYLTALNLPDLKIAEVMVFSNNAYVRVVEQSTGTGAFELLVNPVDQSVTPEPGADMMWNLKYGTLMHALMMGATSGTSTFPSVSAAMAVTPEQAVQDAQAFLDAHFAGDTASASPDAFYGYYTIEIEQNGQTVGMLSVNGSSGEIFYHSWHGTYIDSMEY